VITAAQPFLLDATPFERSAAVRAVRLELVRATDMPLWVNVPLNPSLSLRSIARGLAVARLRAGVPIQAYIGGFKRRGLPSCISSLRLSPSRRNIRCSGGFCSGSLRG